MKFILGLASDRRALGQAVSAARNYRSGNSTVEDVRVALIGLEGDALKPHAVAAPAPASRVLVDASH